MRASGVNAAVMRVIGKLGQNNLRIGVARITGFYCTYLKSFVN